MKKNNGFKRTTAGVLSLALASGMMPGNAGELFSINKEVVVSAVSTTSNFEVPMSFENTTYKDPGKKFVFRIYNKDKPSSILLDDEWTADRKYWVIGKPDDGNIIEVIPYKLSVGDLIAGDNFLIDKTVWNVTFADNYFAKYGGGTECFVTLTKTYPPRTLGVYYELLEEPGFQGEVWTIDGTPVCEKLANSPGIVIVSGTGTESDPYVFKDALAASKESPVATAPSLASGLTYDGTPKSLIGTEATFAQDLQAENIDVKYYVSNTAVDNFDSVSNEDWKDTATATNAGDYYVYYKATVTASEKYNDVPPTLIRGAENADKITIAKANLAETTTEAEADYTAPAAKTLAYNEYLQELITAGTIADTKGTFKYAVSDSEVTDAASFGELSWSTGIPERKETGTYKVYYKIEATANYNNKFDTFETKKSIDAEIAYKSTDITLVGLDDTLTPDGKAAVIIDSEGELVEAVDGKYTLTYGNYKLYTDKVLAYTDAANEIVESEKTNQILNSQKYYKCYNLSIPAVPENGYVLSHSNNFVGVVKNTEPAKLYVGEDGKSGNYAAEMKGSSVYYYGDTPSKDDVEIEDGFDKIVSVEEVYFAEKDGKKVAIEDLVIGRNYDMTAKVLVDNDGDGNTDNNDDGVIDDNVGVLYLKKPVDFKARPLYLCDAYLVNADESETKLTVSGNNNNAEITVPDGTFKYDGEEKNCVIRFKNPKLEGDKAVLGEEEAVIAEFSASDVLNTDSAVNCAENNYHFTVEAVSGEGKYYSGKAVVNWSIDKAKLTNKMFKVAAKEGIVYDGAVLDKDDFEYNGTEAEKLVADSKTSIVVTFNTNLYGEANDGKSAGEQIATFTITSRNYEKATRNVNALIEKRDITITPEAGQFTVYSEAAPKIKYTVEQENKEKNSGCIASDNLELVDLLVVDGYDYTNYTSNAGSYDYKFRELKVLDNYNLITDGEDGEFSSQFTVKPKPLTMDMFNYVADKEVAYNGSIKQAPGITVFDGYFELGEENNIPKITEDDYDKGGTTEAVLPGEYAVEYYGKNNYTGEISLPWAILADDTFQAAVTVEDKEYDGNAVVPEITYKKSGQATADIPKNTTTTYTYYPWDGITPLTMIDVTSLTDPSEETPKNAGNYIVKAHTVARGYGFDDKYDTFTISKRIVNAVPTVTSKEYGKEDPKFTFSTDLNEKLAAGDTVNASGELALSEYDGSVGNYNFTTGSAVLDNDNYALAVNSKFTVTPQEISDANILVTGICVKDATGWAYPGKAVEVSAVVDGETVILEEGTDFRFLSATKTKKTDDFSVQIAGMGNFTGVAAADVTVITDFSQAINVLLNDGVESDVVINPANRQLYVKVRFNGEVVVPGFKLNGYGIIYNNTTANADPDTLTLENADGKTVKIKEGVNGLNIRDYGKGVTAVGYFELEDASGEKTVIYTENIGNKAYQCAEKAPSAVYNPENNGNYVKVGFEGSIEKNGYKLEEYGLIYSNDASVTDASALTLENVDGTTIKMSEGKNGLNIRDNGSGVHAVGYMKITNDAGQMAVIYSNELGASYNALMD